MAKAIPAYSENARLSVDNVENAGFALVEPVDIHRRAVVGHLPPCYDRPARKGSFCALVALKCAFQHPICAVRRPVPPDPHIPTLYLASHQNRFPGTVDIFHRPVIPEAPFHRLPSRGTSKRPPQAAFSFRRMLFFAARWKGGPSAGPRGAGHWEWLLGRSPLFRNPVTEGWSARRVLYWISSKDRGE